MLLRIHNFYSFKDAEIDFSKYKGIVLIEGKNKDFGNGSNGSGKSTIYEALVWVLFGRTIRKSTEEALVNNAAKKDCWVELKLPGIEIKRTKRPTFLTFKVKGKDLTKESVASTQQSIEEYFNTNYKTFLTAHLFGQQNEIDFISASAEDKRTIIKNYLSLDELFKYRETIKELKSVTSAEFKAKESIYQEYHKNVEQSDKTLSGLIVQKNNILTKLKLTKSYSLDEILKLEEEKRRLEETMFFTRDECFSYDGIIAAREAELKQKKKTKADICNTCGTSFGKLTPKQLKDLEDNLEDIKKTRDSIKNKWKALSEKISEIKIPIASSEFHKLNELKDIEGKIELHTKLIIDFTGRRNEALVEKNHLFEKLDILKFWELVFSEQGIMKYIIRNIIDYFNNKCLFYLSYLTNGKIKIIFDDTLQEQISINGIITNYHSLSGGEKKKINLAVLLSLQSLLAFTPKGKFNLLMLDEVVESLDDESVAGLHNLLLELSKDKLILIITHNTVLKDLLSDRDKIQLVKKNGITKVNS